MTRGERALLTTTTAASAISGLGYAWMRYVATGQDPFEDSIHYPFPPGDSHVVYPGTDGPWSSVRFEAQREGFEDLELLRKLAAHEPGIAGRVVRRVCRRFDDYTRKTGTLRSARRALLDAIAAH